MNCKPILHHPVGTVCHPTNLLANLVTVLHPVLPQEMWSKHAGKANDLTTTLPNPSYSNSLVICLPLKLRACYKGFLHSGLNLLGRQVLSDRKLALRSKLLKVVHLRWSPISARTAFVTCKIIACRLRLMEGRPVM